MKVGRTSASIAAFCMVAVLATSAAMAMAANRSERTDREGQPGSGYTQPGQPGSSSAATGSSATQQLSSAMSGQAGQGQLLSSHLLKQKVQDQQGKDIGHISELIVDPSSGRITHAVVSHGQGFMGIGNKEVLLPWSQLRASQSGGDYKFTAEEAQLRVAQEFSRSQFEQRGSATARGQQQNYRGTVVSVDDNALRVRTDEGVMTVSTGKDWSTKKGQLNLKEGDQVQIKGFSSGFGAQRQIVAQEITANNQTITLDTSDRPYRETGQEQDQPRQDQPRSPNSTQPYSPSQPNGSGSGTGTGM